MKDKILTPEERRRISSQYTIAPAYNKGAYQVIPKNDLEVPEHDPETEYVETVLRYRVFRQYVGVDARDDEPWGLYMSSMTHQGAKDVGTLLIIVHSIFCTLVSN